MSGSVNAVNSTDTNNRRVKPDRPSKITVKAGESISSLAKKYGLSVPQFVQWAGLKKASVTAGQKISLPMAQVPKGKGIMAIIREYNMTMEEFGRLNNLPKPYKEYLASAGEKFYVINHTKTPAKTVSSAKRRQQAVPPKKRVVQQSQTSVNRAKWGSSYSPNEIAANLYQKSCDYYGAVGKPDFDALVDEINPKNVTEVLKSYVQNSKNKSKESLINTITSEVRSDKNKRKAAVMKVYDAVSKKYGTPASVRSGFVKELEEQFDSWGMVSTKKLDETINRMMASPKELAVKMEHDIDNKSAAVGKDSFNELISLVTPKNAAQVIKAYDDLKTGESLINGITSEIGSSKQSRKTAVMHIYDALASQKNIPASQRKIFEKELNDQFNSFGIVNTKKLDKMISNMITSASDASASVSNVKKTKKTIKSNPQLEYHIIKNGYETAVGGQRKVSITAAKPAVPVDENGNVIAEVIKFSPSSKGVLSGYTIMVNAGHGWGNNSSGDPSFKPGARYKDSNGKMLEEWYKNRNFADNLIEELTRNGASVIYTTGDAKQACDAKEKYKADMLVSLHCNAVDNNTSANGLHVLYDGIDSKDSDNLAQIMCNQLRTNVNYKCSLMKAEETQHKYLGLIDESNRQRIPAVMLEMGFMSNPKDKLNIDSHTQRKLAMENVTIAVMKYFNADYSKYNR